MNCGGWSCPTVQQGREHQRSGTLRERDRGCTLFQSVSGGGLRKDCGRKPRADEMLRASEVHTAYRAVPVWRPMEKEDIPVAEGIAGAEADKGGGAGGPLGRGNQREQRPGYIHQVQGTFKQRPETESKNISGDSEGHGRAVGRGGVKSAEVKGCTRDAKEGG